MRTTRLGRYALAVLAVVTFGVWASASWAGASGAAPGKNKPRRTTTTVATTTSSVATTTTLATTTTTAPPSSLLVAPTMRTAAISKPNAVLNAEYCSNASVDTANAAVRRVVVVVHGDTRNACDHASYVQDAAGLKGVAGETLVIAPHFLADVDITTTDPGTLYWTEGGWKAGSVSLMSPYVRPWSISSFEVVDILIARATDPAKFPNVQSVVVAGHSAGGQFANRYAAASPTGTVPSAISYRFVVANPSSYLYLDPRRYHGTTLGPLSESEVSACSSYDNYKYGIQAPYTYVRDHDASLLVPRYGARTISYLLGSDDTDPNDASLDTSCAAEWQGVHRLERGTRYYAYLGVIYGSGIYARQTMATVAGVGHSAHDVYTSAEGLAALFG